MRILQTIILLFFSFGLFGQPTNWNEYKLKEHWKTNGADEIEGIYENTVESGLRAKYKLGLVKRSNGYSLIYLSGAKGDDAWRWNTSDIKAYLTPTATQYLFKTRWYMADKTTSESLYITFEKGIMNIIWQGKEPVPYLIDGELGLIWTDKRPDLYLQLYPTSEDKISIPAENRIPLSGTGFAISLDGLIVTNNHVIEGAKIIKVRGVNGDFSRTYNAKILFTDNNNDLAIIKIDDYGFTSLGTIPYTIKTSLAGVGENIFVLGYPLRATMGDEIKLTNGIVSSKTGFQGDITCYQISAPVQPGNSGGPLFNSQGNLIGVINAKHVGAENASYAVKSIYLTSLIELLSSSPKLQTINSLTGKTLITQVEMVKKFVYIIEVE